MKTQAHSSRRPEHRDPARSPRGGAGSRHASALGCALLLLLPLTSCIGPGLEPPDQGGARSPARPTTPPPAVNPADAGGVPGNDFGNPVGPERPTPDGMQPEQQPPTHTDGPGSAGTSGSTDEDDAGVP